MIIFLGAQQEREKYCRVVIPVETSCTVSFMNQRKSCHDSQCGGAVDDRTCCDFGCLIGTLKISNLT